MGWMKTHNRQPLLLMVRNQQRDAAVYIVRAGFREGEAASRRYIPHSSADGAA